MPTFRLFDQCPPFPSNLPVLGLKKVSLSALESNNAEEGQKLLSACQEWGFFLLDLSESKQGATMLRHAENMFNLTEDLSEMNHETLKEYPITPPDFSRYVLLCLSSI